MLQEPMANLVRWKPDRSNSWMQGEVAFGHHLQISSDRMSLEQLPFYHPETNSCITADCRIDYREELAGQLEIDLDSLETISDSELIMKAYLKWGRQCVSYLTGDFAFAIWDGRNKELFSARDHLGCRPFFYFEDDQYFIFSTSLRGLAAVPEIPIELSQKYLLYYYGSKALPKERTLYQGISRLSPAHSLCLGSGKKSESQQYWEIQVDPNVEALGMEEAIVHLRKLLNEAVFQRVRDLSTVGLELSGGIDSSTIAAVLHRFKQDQTRVHAFVHTMSEKQKLNFFPFTDEQELSKKMAAFAGMEIQTLVDGEGGSGSLKAVMDALEVNFAPLIQLFPTFSDQLHEAVQSQQIKVLLSGFGGDECVSSKAETIVNEYALDGRWKDLYRHLTSKPIYIKFFTIAALFFRFRLPGMQWLFISLTGGKNSRYKMDDLAMDKSFLKQFRDLEQEWAAENKPLYRVREQQKHRLMHEHVADRLENSYLLAQEKGIAYAYPLLDIRLISFIYSLPAGYKNHEGVGRYLIRRALEGWAPDEIRLSNNKFGAAVPNFFYRLQRDTEDQQALIREAVNNVDFHYLDYEKLQWQLRELLDQNKFLKLSFGPKVYISALSLLILQKWQREGKIDIGIKH